MIENHSDDVIIGERIRSGDHSAFAELYSRYKHGVYLFCTRFLGDNAASEDVFQDVFLNCFEQLRSGKEIQNLKGYLLSAAHNRCLNVIRDRKYPEDIDGMADTLPTRDSDPALQQDLQAALQQVSPDNREALLLCEYQGYSYEEIARITSVPVSTVRKRIFRARQKLRTLLSPDMIP